MRDDHEPKRARIRRSRRPLLPFLALAASLVPAASRGQSMASLPPPRPSGLGAHPASGPAAGGTRRHRHGVPDAVGCDALGFGGSARDGSVLSEHGRRSRRRRRRPRRARSATSSSRTRTRRRAVLRAGGSPTTATCRPPTSSTTRSRRSRARASRPGAARATTVPTTSSPAARWRSSCCAASTARPTRRRRRPARSSWT